MKSRWFIRINFNPWKQNIGDCAIRAISAATGLDYREVCKKLGMSYVKGKGLRRDSGIDLYKIEEIFDDYFDVVTDFYTDMDFTPDEFKGSKEDMLMKSIEQDIGIDSSSSGDTLNDFCEMYKGKGTFLVSLVGNPNAENAKAKRTGGHIVCVKLNPGAKLQGFVDTWDSGEMIVDAFMRVSKFEPKDSPKHWKYDKAAKKFIV